MEAIMAKLNIQEMYDLINEHGIIEGGKIFQNKYPGEVRETLLTFNKSVKILDAVTEGDITFGRIGTEPELYFKLELIQMYMALIDSDPKIPEQKEGGV
jgi:hypothetical protein